MKKSVLLVIFLILGVLFVFTPPKLKAQVFDANKAYADYQYQLSMYQNAYSSYQEARNFYLKNPTLQLKAEARRKTLKMLRERETLMAVYLTALRMQILETRGFDQAKKDAILGKIEQEVEWYKNQATKYQDSDEPIDLFNKSDESKSRMKTNTSTIVNESLFDITLSQEMGIRIDHQNVFTDLKKYIDDRVLEGRLKIDPFNRWLNDIDSILQDLTKNETAALDKIQSMYSQSYNVKSSYESAVEITKESLPPLAQLNSYLSEMLTSIQNQMK